MRGSPTGKAITRSWRNGSTQGNGDEVPPNGCVKGRNIWDYMAKPQSLVAAEQGPTKVATPITGQDD